MRICAFLNSFLKNRWISIWYFFASLSNVTGTTSCRRIAPKCYPRPFLLARSFEGVQVGKVFINFLPAVTQTAKYLF